MLAEGRRPGSSKGAQLAGHCTRPGQAGAQGFRAADSLDHVPPAIGQALASGLLMAGDHATGGQQIGTSFQWW